MSVSDFTPTAADIGAILRARTKDSSGAEIGTFNASTRPTGTQVESLIADAVREVESAMGTDSPCEDGSDIQTSIYGKAKAAAKIYTAMLVELSHFPEQVESGRSPYDQLEKLWNSRVASLTEMVAESCGGGSDAGGIGGLPLPRATMPTQAPVGRRTRW